ncbi:carboxymuconolactone decarboxylase family protein [Parageobacillus sp. VR-IP]|uniref:carboxymuconolactone decarboxylase family protein n=1 Tax=Parageobacillus sp. VR-IP TaxID=2742205 RepID=UPI0015819203|nr:carboxymuconolactone decarboxylase family protein [Parageobacillus sp. VR-IP]NUK31360.1 carboxymuconolactone decarboxylase family protein [Parageobacillus sp. VR-IP]
MTNQDPLKFFEQVYGEIPEWVQKMSCFSPKALEYYTKLRHEIMADGAISKKDKELILVGINAARRYKRSMIYHTKGAIDSGATIMEIADILTVCIISRGIPAWLTGIEAIRFAESYTNTKLEESNMSNNLVTLDNIDDCICYYNEETGGSIPLWVELLKKASPNVLQRYSNLRKLVLSDHVVSRKIKELVLVGVNVAERYRDGVKIHVNGAKKHGATDKEIAEVCLVAVLTAGIPAWFEGSDFLSLDEK